MAALETITFGLAVLIFAGWCFQWYVHLLAILYGKWKLHRKTATLSPECLPGVSILKPLTGVDPHLYENLETFFNMDYPSFELLFCIEEEIDPAIMVVQSLLNKYPKVDAKMYIGAKKIGLNPKINNMVQGYEAAKYELFLISDSGLKMREDTLMDIVSFMKENVGLVHQMPFVCDRKGFAAVLEKVYFGTQFAKIYLNADFYGINTTTGMSCLMRKEVIEDAGGLRIFGQYLPEDYFLAQAFIDRGWKVRICSQPAWQNAGNYSISNFQARMIRWAKLRGALVPCTLILEPLSECILLGIIAAWAVTVMFNWSGLAFFFVHVLVWFLFDYILLVVIQNGPCPFSKFEYVVCWLFRELSSFYMLLKSHSDPLLTWRSKRYIIKWGGLGEEVRTRSYV
jgi:ceramide glucosyltransferase